MSARYPLALPGNTPAPAHAFITPAGMIEDEQRRNAKASPLEQRLHDLDIGVQDERPWQPPDETP